MFLIKIHLEGDFSKEVLKNDWRNCKRVQSAGVNLPFGCRLIRRSEKLIRKDKEKKKPTRPNWGEDTD